jgi:hypothetical protein
MCDNESDVMSCLCLRGVEGDAAKVGMRVLGLDAVQKPMTRGRIRNVRPLRLPPRSPTGEEAGNTTKPVDDEGAGIRKTTFEFSRLFTSFCVFLHLIADIRPDKTKSSYCMSYCIKT